MSKSVELIIEESDGVLTIRSTQIHIAKVILFSGLTTIVALTDSFIWILFFPVGFFLLVYTLTLGLNYKTITRWIVAFLWATFMTPFILLVCKWFPPFWLLIPPLSYLALVVKMTVSQAADGVYITSGLFIEHTTHLDMEDIHEDTSVLDSKIFGRFLRRPEKEYIKAELKAFAPKPNKVVLGHENSFEAPVAKTREQANYKSIDEA